MKKQIALYAVTLAFWLLFCLWPFHSALLPVWAAGAAITGLMTTYGK